MKNEKMGNLNDKGISLAIVLGSGLGESMADLPQTEIISEDFEGIHKKLVYLSNIEGKKALIFSGRKHYYEGYSLEEITANMITANSMGVKNILITNAAGGINENFKVGDMMLIRSHMNLNQTLSFEKKHFPYSPELYANIASICKLTGIGMHEGVYCCASGPAYETRAEIRMLKRFGIDAVGMSTVPESFRAADLKMNVAGISVITNLLKENDFSPPDHNEILTAASLAAKDLFCIIKSLVNELN